VAPEVALFLSFVAEVTGISTSMSKGLKATEGSLSRQVETLLKASAKKAEDERRKSATRERGDMEKIIGNAIREVSCGRREHGPCMPTHLHTILTSAGGDG
jgi:hypothetical protein